MTFCIPALTLAYLMSSPLTGDGEEGSSPSQNENESSKLPDAGDEDSDAGDDSNSQTPDASDPGDNDNEDSTSEQDDPGSDASDPKFDLGPLPDFETSGEGCKIDFLFVVDNSISMDDEQAALAQAVPGFVRELDAHLEGGCKLSHWSDHH